ncbi:MAG: hypothetical protein JW874_03940, partial [Spirochaetales bacterium]|nr:hypothetical protein [Spirochaetales bacterium]
YLATAPKSNSALAFFDALSMAEQEGEVPNHLRDDSRDRQGFGHGEGYLYPHSFRNHWVAQHYLPESMQGRIFYQPGSEGYEGRIRDEVFRKREIQLEQALHLQSAEQLSYSPEDREKERWLRRAEAEQAAILARIRSTLFSGLDIPRHARVLDLNSGSGLFVWEALRKVPEGGVWAVCSSKTQKQVIEHFAGQLALPERPELLILAPEDYREKLTKLLPAGIRFDLISARDILPAATEKGDPAGMLSTFAAAGAQLVLAQKISDGSSRLGDFLEFDQNKLQSCFKKAEDEAFSRNSIPDRAAIETLVKSAGFEHKLTEVIQSTETRTIRQEDVDTWFATDRKKQSGYGTIIRELYGEETLARIRTQALALAGMRIEWKTSVFLFRGIK